MEKNTFVHIQGKKKTQTAANVKTETRFQESFCHEALREKHAFLIDNYDHLLETCSCGDLAKSTEKH